MSRSNQELAKEANKYSNKRDFRKNSAAHHIQAYRRGILDHICRHMVYLIPRQLSNEELIKTAQQYDSRRDLIKYSGVNIYNCIKNRKIEQQAFEHMTKLNSKYTLKNAKLISQNYSTMKMLKKEHPKLVDAIYAHKWVNSINSHMTKLLTHKTDIELKKAALLYNSPMLLLRNDPKTYNIIIKRGLGDKAFSHMTKRGGTSCPEKQVANYIKQLGYKYTTLRHRNIMLLEKNYINGFDVDIYIHDLNKGIEFDGDYWHRPDIMQKSRPSWPLLDILFYNQLKDYYFQSKGIEILHIKECDWKNRRSWSKYQIADFLLSPLNVNKDILHDYPNKEALL